MARLIAKGSIEITLMTDIYEIRLSSDSVAIPANEDGSNPVLEVAKTRLTVSKEGIVIPIDSMWLQATNCEASFEGRTVYLTSISAETGQVVINFVVDGDQQRSITFTWSLAKQGEQGADGYSIVLDNESHTIPASPEGVVTSTELDKAMSRIRAWRGNVELAPVAANATPGIGQFRYNIISTEGCTAVRINTGDDNNRAFKLTAMSADSAKVNVNIKLEGRQDVNKTMTVTKAKAGQDGGKGDPGDDAPFVVNRQDWKANLSYYGGSDMIEQVNYNGQIYVTKKTAGVIPTGTLPTDTQYWDDFFINSPSLYTEILSAVTANIQQLVVEKLKVVSGASSTTIGVIPSSPSDPTVSSVFKMNGQRQYYESGRIASYTGIVDNLQYDYSGSTKTYSGWCIVAFKDESGSPVHFVLDSSTASGIQYAGNAGPRWWLINHSLISSSLPSTATASDFIYLFESPGGSGGKHYLNETLFCGHYDWPIYSGSIGVKSSGTIYKKTEQGQADLIVTALNGSTPVADGWYYGVSGNRIGAATNSYDDYGCSFNFDLDVHYIENGLITNSITVNFQNGYIGSALFPDPQMTSCTAGSDTAMIGSG